jgi:hypothetical protein
MAEKINVIAKVDNQVKQTNHEKITMGDVKINY